MVQTRRKDDSSFSTTLSLRRSTRETRERVLRFEDSDKDDEDFATSAPTWQLRARRLPKRSRRASIQYNSSLSLRSRDVDSDSEDESHSDDSIFQTRRSSKPSRRVSRSQGRHPADHVETSNDHIDMAMEEDLAQPEDDGIRRSTRRRSHPPSWLVGDETVRGYPSYSRNTKETTTPEMGSTSRGSRTRDRNNSELPQPEATAETERLRSHRSTPRQEVKKEAEEDDEEDKEEKPSKKKNVEKATEEEANKENGSVSSAEEDAAEKETPLMTRSRSIKDAPHLDENFPDMYSRVKRVRRQTKRFSISHSNSRKFSGRDGEIMSQTQSSSGSDDSDSDREQASQRSSRSTRRTYQLRVNKPTVDRFQAHHEPVRRPPRSFQQAVCNSVLRRLGRRTQSRFAPDSSSSSSDERARFDHKKTPSRHVPHHPKDVKVGGSHSKDVRPTTLADIDPMALDTSIRFQNVGGLEDHIHCLQEIVVFPMLYKDIFEKFHITPPKGVLFHGPPGTGKTLIARALANECSQGERKVSFFMRKGADCLSKWVGESERQLRLLFEQAYKSKPSIIFFDEIDGLAPVRSSKQDQIHASIVSTLLALMDGLDNRGDVIVIGATNRIDAIDPALRRPGRFDRELYFPLPACKERQEILQIHVSKWENKPDTKVLSKLAEQSSGYCGSDLRALCSESVIQALRRTYPQIYKSNQRLLLDPNKVQVASEDFALACSSIVPAAHRVSPSPARKLPVFVEPLLTSKLNDLTSQLKEIFPHGLSRDKNMLFTVHRPRLLIVGESSEQAQTSHLAPALLHHMEHVPVFVLDLGTMYEVSARSPEETVSQVFQEARRNPPSVIYLPGLGQWWDLVPHTVQAVFLMHLQKLDMNSPVFLLATSDVKYADLPSELSSIFSGYRDEIFTMSNPNCEERKNFFRPLFFEISKIPPSPPKLTEETWEELPVAPPPEPAKLSEEELQKLYAKEEHTLRELRIFLREVCAKLARNRLFFMFTKPVDVEEAPDYYDIIEKPMDLETMMTRIDQHQYVCAKEFLDDIDLICRNALEYNPNRDQADKLIRHRACFLRDTAYALIKAEMDTDFEDRCRTISADRKKRKDSPSRYAPAPEFLQTAPSFNVKGQTTNGSKDGLPRVNGDLSSHSSVASNNATQATSMSGRKRRPSSWSRGCISKPKRKKMMEDGNGKVDQNAPDGDNQVSPPASPTTRSNSPTDLSSKHVGELQEPSEKTVEVGGLQEPSEKNEEAKASMNGSCDDIEMNELNPSEAKSSNEECLKDSKPSVDAETSHEGKETSKSKRISSEGNKSKLGRQNTSTEITPEEVLINNSDLEKLLTQTVSATKDCNVETLIELYIRLEKITIKFRDIWDRTSLPQTLKEEVKRFEKYTECN